MDDNQLLKQTQQYWRVSSTWNSRLPNQRLTIQQGLKQTKEILDTCHSNKKLRPLVACLMADIIKPLHKRMPPEDQFPISRIHH